MSEEGEKPNDAGGAGRNTSLRPNSEATTSSTQISRHVSELDPDLLQKAHTQWQFGDWASLASLATPALEQHPDRASLALLAAAGLFQAADPEVAREYVQRARDWGCPESMIRRVLISGVYNSLGRARMAEGKEDRAAPLMEQASVVAFPQDDAQLINSARTAYQAAELGVHRSRSEPETGTRSAAARNRKGDPFPAASKLATSPSQPTDPVSRLHRNLDRLTYNVIESGLDLTLDGIRVFEADDPFLPGKLALGLSYRVIERSANSQQRERACRDFRDAMELVRGREQKSWGIYYYLLALSRLKQHNLLEAALSPQHLEELRQQLDWRGFVDEATYDLIRKPTNFYNVAFSIAQLRADLGWDDPHHAEVLLQKMVDHYRRHSGDHGFADETGGEGRYDRYSILLIAEIGHRFREAGRAMPPELQNWLRRSAEVALVNLNERGDGFQYGRSIGAYGDTAYLEILTSAAWHGLLSPVEMRMGYLFSLRATEKFLNFWYDEKRQAVNLWEDGRSTDGYRGKHRILGETLTLLQQHLSTHEIWRRLEVPQREPTDSEFSSWLRGLPRATLTRFAEGDYSRALLTVRDGEHVFSLPLVNGARYHDQTAYNPTPFSHKLIQAIPESLVPQLVPRIELDDESVLMPLSFMRCITLEQTEEAVRLVVEQDAMDALGGKHPEPDPRISLRTTFEFHPECVTRKDEFTRNPQTRIRGISLQLVTDARGAEWSGNDVVLEGAGTRKLEVDGYTADDLIMEHDGTPGPMAKQGGVTRVRWKGFPTEEESVFRVAWAIRYAP